MTTKASRNKNGVRNHKHKIGIALAGSGLLFSGGGHALTIGAPLVSSYLAQPLQVAVPITELAAQQQINNYTIRALPASEYGALGLAPPDFPVQNLQFRWQKTSSDKAKVLISSRRAMTEPVVNILLEIRGQRQRWVRQLNLLLDPPPAGATTTPTITQFAPASSTGFVPNSARRTLNTPGHRSQYGPVQAGEVLSVIAQNVRMDSKIPLTQMAQAIIDANAAAFPDGPRSLSVGAMLNIPSQQQIARASKNDALMAPLHNRNTRAGNESSEDTKGDAAATQKSKAFLPKYIRLNGHFYPLSVEFLSYEDIRPVDLQPTLQALEAAEPMRFRADWTLSSLAPSDSSPSGFMPVVEGNASTSKTKATPSTNAAETDQTADSTSVRSSTDVTLATQDLLENVKGEARKEASVTLPSLANDLNRLHFSRLDNSQADDLSYVVPSKPSSVLVPNQPASSTPAQSTINLGNTTTQPQRDNAISLFWWLILIPAAAAVAWARGWRWYPEKLRRLFLPQTSPADVFESMQPEEKTPDQPLAPLERSPADDIVRQALLRRLKPALESADEKMVRNAKVALALFDRGRIAEAESRADEVINTMAESTSPEVVTASKPAALKTKTVQPAAVDNSEFEQRRILKAIRKLLNTTMSAESERQLKVAAALCERNNIERAQQILEQVKENLSEQTAERSAS